LALVAARLSPKSRASVRHLIFGAAFAALLVLPIATVTVPAVDLPIATSSGAASTVWSINSSQVARSTELNAAGAQSEPVTNRMPLSLFVVLRVVWAAGAAIFLLPMAAGLWQLRRVRRFAAPWLDGERIVRQLASDAGIGRPLAVLLSESISEPVTCGAPSRPVPQDARTWNDDMRRAIIHELEHVRRCDWLMHRPGRAALYWFHPFGRMSWRQLSLKAERACDDAVLRQNRSDNAEQLLTLAQASSRRRPDRSWP
jgi:beta-lactamase regulating signal transducer with metallopeptidase domain